MKFVLILTMLAMFLFTVAAAEVPKLDFDVYTCSVFVTPQGEGVVDRWFVCINDRQFLALVEDADRMEVHCDYSVPIVPHEWMDVSNYVDCGIVTPARLSSFGRLKGMYR